MCFERGQSRPNGFQLHVFRFHLSAIVGGESFADLFAESLKEPGHEVRRGHQCRSRARRSQFRGRQRRPESEALIPLEEFLNDQGELEVQPGDFVSVAIDSLENGYGDTILSRDRAKRLSAWLQRSRPSRTASWSPARSPAGQGRPDRHDQRHPRVLPGSLVDLRPVKDTTPYEGKTLEFKVIKLDRKRNNVVLSRRQVLEASMGEERQKLLETLHEGAVVKGVVKNITDYGAFVDLGGIDGLLHITDMAWRRVRHPSEVLQVGQEVEAKVLKFDQEKSPRLPGRQQLGEDPWGGLARRYPQGTRPLFGKVTNLTDYGAFVEVEAGIEGLVHVSEMDWTNKNVDPRKVVTLGEEVEVMVLEIDEDRRRISLGMKQCRQNPWKSSPPTSSVVTRSAAPSSRSPTSACSSACPAASTAWSTCPTCRGRNRARKPCATSRRATRLEAVVLGIDTDKERISLGIKQLEGDPFNNFVAHARQGRRCSGHHQVGRAQGAVITLSVDVEGYLRASEISSGRVEDATTVLKAAREHRSHDRQHRPQGAFDPAVDQGPR